MSIERRLRELERRLRELPPSTISFVDDQSGASLFSLGSGDRHEVRVSGTEKEFLCWLWDNRDSDLSGTPILLVGENRAGQNEAAQLGACLLALLRHQRARLYTHPRWIQDAVQPNIRRILPPQWRSTGDEAANHYPIGGGVDIVSIKSWRKIVESDISVVDDYSLGPEARIRNAIECGTIRLVAGDEPQEEREQWICALRDAALSRGRLFRFRRKPSDVNRFVDIISPETRLATERFWKSTGL
jgi:hypothetical protein